MDTVITAYIDELNDEQLEQAIVDFLVEQKLIGEFLVWIEKWKSNHKIN